MPLLKRRTRGDYVKVFRPAGTRYAEARHNVISIALDQAFEKFREEFDCIPRQNETSIEIMGVTGLWCVSVFEVKD